MMVSYLGWGPIPSLEPFTLFVPCVAARGQIKIYQITESRPQHIFASYHTDITPGSLLVLYSRKTQRRY